MSTHDRADASNRRPKTTWCLGGFQEVRISCFRSRSEARSDIFLRPAAPTVAFSPAISKEIPRESLRDRATSNSSS